MDENGLFRLLIKIYWYRCSQCSNAWNKPFKKPKLTQVGVPPIVLEYHSFFSDSYADFKGLFFTKSNFLKLSQGVVFKL